MDTPIKERPMRYIRRLNARLLTNRNAALEPAGLTASQADILLYILIHSKHIEITVSKLLEFYPLTHQTVTGVVNRLESKGLIARKRSSADARCVILIPTDAGKCLDQQMYEHSFITEEKMLTGFSSEERARFLEYLRRALQNLEEADQTSSPC